MDMLPHLDFSRLSELPPKWICGYSDITTLTFALTVCCDIATIHDPNFIDMGCATIHESDLAAFEAMSKPEITQKIRIVGIDSRHRTTQRSPCMPSRKKRVEIVKQIRSS